MFLRGKSVGAVLFFQEQYRPNKGKGTAGKECSHPSDGYFSYPHYSTALS